MCLNLMGCWNTTNYGGRHTQDNSEMGRVWTFFYANAIKNITDAQYRTVDDAKKVNINSALSIYKAYLISIIADIYGDAPYSEAGKGLLEDIYTPRYDKQEDIYNDFFLELSAAATNLDASKDRITGDVLFNGNVDKWKKLANSLRLRFAMRISDVAPQKGQEKFESALQADGGVFENATDDALIKYMNISFSFGQEAYSDYRGNALSQLLFGNDPANNPYYLCSTFFDQLYNTNDPRTFRIARCYYDGLMSSTSPDDHIDLTEGEHRVILVDAGGSEFGGNIVNVSNSALITSGADRTNANREWVMSGINLDQITSLTFGGQTITEFIQQTATEVTIICPSLADGEYKLTGKTKSGDDAQFYSAKGISTEQTVTVSSETVLWQGHHYVSWDRPDGDPNKMFNLIGKDVFATITAGATLSIHYSVASGDEYHQLRTTSGWWDDLPGTSVIEFSESGVKEVLLTQEALNKIQAEDGFLCIGHGYYVNMITVQ